jgi:hypothetical protein
LRFPLGSLVAIWAPSASAAPGRAVHRPPGTPDTPRLVQSEDHGDCSLVRHDRSVRLAYATELSLEGGCRASPAKGPHARAFHRGRKCFSVSRSCRCTCRPDRLG